MGIPVVIATNGRGIPVKQVEKNAPVMEVAKSGLGMPIVLSDRGIPAVVKGAGVTDALMAALSPNGEDYEFLDFGLGSDRLFQENTGITPATVIGNTVGLSVGKEKAQGKQPLSEAVSAQSEKVVNGDFSGTDKSPWTDQGGASSSVVGGALRVSSPSANGYSQQSISGLDTAKMYRVRGTVSNVSSGSAFVLTRTNVGAAIAGSPNVSGPGPQIVEFFFVPTTSPVLLRLQVGSAGATADFDNISVKEVPAHYAAQSAGNMRPQLQANGAKFDGNDDSLATDWKCSAVSNTVFAQVSFPASVGAIQSIFGTQQGGGRFRLDLNVSGILVFQMDGGTIILNGVGDVRGRTLNLAVIQAGANVTVYVDGVPVATSSTVGATPPNTINPIRLAANDNAGSPSQWFGGAIRFIAFGTPTPTAAQVQAVHQQFPIPA